MVTSHLVPNPGETSPEVQNRGINGPQFFFKSCIFDPFISEMCQYEGKHYPIRKPIFELESDPLCSAYFDEDCNKRGRCERANIPPTM